jgi:hypothetical protein
MMFVEVAELGGTFGTLEASLAQYRYPPHHHRTRVCRVVGRVVSCRVVSCVSCADLVGWAGRTSRPRHQNQRTNPSPKSTVLPLPPPSLLDAHAHATAHAPPHAHTHN